MVPVVTKFVVLALVLVGIANSSAIDPTRIPQAWRDEALGWFRDIVRIPSPSLPPPKPYAEVEVLNYLKGVLDVNNIVSDIVEVPVPPGAPIPPMKLLYARIVGTNGKFVLMGSHSDTAQLENFANQSLALSGAIIDGKIIGRGTIDMKYKTIYDMATLIWHKRLGIVPTTGLLFVVFPNEEIGMVGASLVVANPALSATLGLHNVILATNEGSGITTAIDGESVMPIGFGEKGICPVALEIFGSDSHPTVYATTSSINQIGQAIAVTYDYVPEPVYTPVNLELLRELKTISRDMRRLAHKLERPRTFERAVRELRETDPQLAALIIPQFTTIRNTNHVESYVAFNVIPGYAYAEVVSMMLPGQPDACVRNTADVRRAVDNVAVNVSLIPLTGMTMDQTLMIGGGTYVDIANPAVSDFFAAIQSTLARDMSDTIPIHTYMPAICDCFALQMAGIPCVDFAPLRMPEKTLVQVAHSEFEYVPLAGFNEGILVYASTLSAFATR